MPVPTDATPCTTPPPARPRPGRRQRRRGRRQGRWSGLARRIYAAWLVLATCLTVLAAAGPAFAAPAHGGGSTKDLATVINDARGWIIGILAALATLFVVVAGVLYLTSGGDAGEVEKAKRCLKSAAIGYGLAMLAVPLMAALKSIVGA